jgi:hypothetical protein
MASVEHMSDLERKYREMIKFLKNWYGYLTARQRLTLGCIVVLPLAYVSGQLSYGEASPASVPQPTTVISHENSCYYQARVSRNIPAYSVDQSKGLLAYTRRHLHGSTPDAELADYWQALRACDAVANPAAKWNWNNMYVVNTEEVP